MVECIFWECIFWKCRVKPIRPYKRNEEYLTNGTANGTMGRIVQAFKSKSTHQYIIGVKKHDWPSFNKHLWQRNYYERVLRNEKELDIRRQYIENNPINWVDDEYNPLNQNLSVSNIDNFSTPQPGGDE